jgi:hypothetical protein
VIAIPGWVLALVVLAAALWLWRAEVHDAD